MASPGSLPSASVDASGVRRRCRQRLRTCSITRRYEAYRDVSLKLKFVGAEEQGGRPTMFFEQQAIEGLRETCPRGDSRSGATNSATNQKT
jgi:hypothetical protein